MRLVILLAALLAAGPKPASIYVGPVVRDGFVDVDQGVLDSIKDITEEVRKNGAFVVVANEAAARLKLYVVTRAKVETGADVSIGSASGTTTGTSTQGIGTSVTIPVELLRVETLLRVGSYERAFKGESGTSWKRCAGSISKDLDVWLAANRERIPVP